MDVCSAIADFRLDFCSFIRVFAMTASENIKQDEEAKNQLNYFFRLPSLGQEVTGRTFDPTRRDIQRPQVPAMLYAIKGHFNLIILELRPNRGQTPPAAAALVGLRKTYR